jgi:hypothetical protein
VEARALPAGEDDALQLLRQRTARTGARARGEVCLRAQVIGGTV